MVAGFATVTGEEICQMNKTYFFIKKSAIHLFV